MLQWLLRQFAKNKCLHFSPTLAKQSVYRVVESFLFLFLPLSRVSLLTGPPEKDDADDFATEIYPPDYPSFLYEFGCVRGEGWLIRFRTAVYRMHETYHHLPFEFQWNIFYPLSLFSDLEIKISLPNPGPWHVVIVGFFESREILVLIFSQVFHFICSQYQFQRLFSCSAGEG